MTSTTPPIRRDAIQFSGKTEKASYVLDIHRQRDDSPTRETEWGVEVNLYTDYNSEKIPESIQRISYSVRTSTYASQLGVLCVVVETLRAHGVDLRSYWRSEPRPRYDFAE